MLTIVIVITSFIARIVNFNLSSCLYVSCLYVYGPRCLIQTRTHQEMR